MSHGDTGKMLQRMLDALNRIGGVQQGRLERSQLWRTCSLGRDVGKRRAFLPRYTFMIALSEREWNSHSAHGAAQANSAAEGVTALNGQ